MRTYNKTKSHQNIPRRNNAAEKNWNPINGSSISTNDTGIVSLSKGNVFYDLNDNEGARGTEFFSEVVVRDEYGNLVKMLRSSDIEDTSALGSYINNQTIHNSPNERLGYIDGRPSNAEKDANTKFTFSVNTNTTYEGSTTSTQFQLPLISRGTISMNVDWGDGTSDIITTYNQAETLHTYAASGVYTIKITNEVRGWQFINSGDKLKMNDISNWGQFNITNNQSFYGCSNMTSTATDSPIIESFTLFRTFRGCYLFNGVVNNWDTRGVSDIQQMFHDCHIFNQPLSNWNTSSVIYMNYIFANCDEFNQPLNNWDMSSAQRMFGAFFGTHKFNQPLNNWDVSSVTDMSYMFFKNDKFNQPLNNWNVSSVTLMPTMFYQAYDFNQPLSFWNTSSVTDMENMFLEATNFNQDLGNWNIESVTNMNNIMLGGTLGTSNYDSLLTGWLGSPTVIDPEFVTNGDFNDGLTGWTLTGAESATQTLVAGGLEMYSGTVADNQNRMSQTSTPQGYLNKTYTLTIDASDFVGSNAGYIRLDGYYDSSNIIRFTASTTSVTFKAYRNFTFIVFFSGGANKYYTVDNISLKEVLNAPSLDLNPNFGTSEYKLYGDAETARNELVNNYGWTITDGGGVLPTDESFEFSVDTNSQTLGSENIDLTIGSTIDASSWSSVTASGVSYLAGGNNPSYYNTGFSVTSGSTYRLSFTLSDYTGSNNLGFSTSGGVSNSARLYADGSYSESFIASSSTELRVFGRNTNTGVFSNVSVKEVLSDTDQFQLPLISSGDINMVVHWGDTTTSNITSYNQAETLHTYPSAGTYTINIYREVKGWKFNLGGDRLKMRAISNWGVFNVTEHSSFYGCYSMTCTATTAPVVSSTNLQQTFRGCNFFNGAIGNWNVRNVTDFYTFFHGCNSFNQPLNNWDTSSVNRTRFMFYSCSEFNQPINNWDMKSVGNMGYMFLNATNFDQNISQWDITSATEMTSFMQGVTLSTTNYDELLMQWEDSGSVQEPELVSNGDFSEEGVELVDNGDFAIYEDATDSNLDGGVQFDDWNVNPDNGKRKLTTIANGFINEVIEKQTQYWQQRVTQDVSGVLEVGKYYRFKATFITSDGSNLRVAVQNLNSSYTQVGGNYATEAGISQSIDLFFKCTHINSQYIQIFPSPTQEIGESFSLQNVSLKEVGQDWTVSNTDANNYVVFNGSTARLKFLNTSPITEFRTTDVILTGGKTYELIVDIAVVTSGGVKFDTAGVNEVFNAAGINTRTIKPTSNTRLVFYRATSNVDLTFNSVSAKEMLNSPPIGITTNFGGSQYTAEAIPARESLVNSYGWTIVDGGESV